MLLHKYPKDNESQLTSNSTRLLPFCFYRVGSHNLEAKELNTVNAFSISWIIRQHVLTIPSGLTRRSINVYVFKISFFGVFRYPNGGPYKPNCWISLNPNEILNTSNIFFQKNSPSTHPRTRCLEINVKDQRKAFCAISWANFTKPSALPRLANPWRWWENPPSKNGKIPGNVKSSMANLI